MNSGAPNDPPSLSASTGSNVPSEIPNGLEANQNFTPSANANQTLEISLGDAVFSDPESLDSVIHSSPSKRPPRPEPTPPSISSSEARRDPPQVPPELISDSSPKPPEPLIPNSISDSRPKPLELPMPNPISDSSPKTPEPPIPSPNHNPNPNPNPNPHPTSDPTPNPSSNSGPNPHPHPHPNNSPSQGVQRLLTGDEISLIKTLASSLEFAFDQSELGSDFARSCLDLRSLNLDVLAGGSPRQILYPLNVFIEVWKRETSSSDMEWFQEAESIRKETEPVLNFLPDLLLAYPDLSIGASVLNDKSSVDDFHAYFHSKHKPILDLLQTRISRSDLLKITGIPPPPTISIYDPSR